MEGRDWKDSIYDLIVIGAGPGGEGAAMQAAKQGLAVAMVDDRADVGGNCTHVGTIPSKALRHAVQQMNESGTTGWGRRQGDRSWPAMLRQSQEVVRRQVNLRSSFYERNNISRHRGRARFLDAHRISLNDERGQRGELQAKAFVIATGSHPFHPPELDFSHPRILDSDGVLRMDFTPKSITVVGAGVIGCEYASIFRSLSVKVSLINSRSQLLSFLDDEIIDALAYHLREQGVHIRHNEEIESVDCHEDHIEILTKSNKRIVCDALLWAQGRSGNSSGLGLEDIGIELGNRGTIKVNEDYQTALEHIYAVGDVVGSPSLASAAYDQGRFAATHLLEGNCQHRLVEHIPSGIYTIPEISSIGKTEKELTMAGIPYEVGHAQFRHLARAQITGKTTGILKLLFHRDTRQILGIHCFGYQASEIIHIGQAIMSQPGEGNSVDYFVNTTFNYPTMAEAYRVAALNGINRLNGQ